MKIFTKDEKKVFFQKRDLDYLRRVEGSKKLEELGHKNFDKEEDTFLSSRDKEVIAILKSRKEVPNYIDILKAKKEDLMHYVNQLQESLDLAKDLYQRGHTSFNYVMEEEYLYKSYSDIVWRSSLGEGLPLEKEVDGYQVKKGNYTVFETTVPSLYVFQKEDGKAFSMKDQEFISFYENNVVKILCQRQRQKQDFFTIYTDKWKEKGKVYMLLERQKRK